jgi:hypothetical protein
VSFINEELVQTRFERKGLIGSVLETGTGARAKHRRLDWGQGQATGSSLRASVVCHDSPLALTSGARRCLLLSAVVCNAEADLQNSSVFDTEVDATLMVVCIPLGRASSILAHDSRGHIGSL